ncbi:cellulose binding domain-containing protein, partial [Catellatospora sp. NPDC049609]|uniref:cellulose binding domain-containing protein n=1 Tax=Catellatospora sp. NPDC049609 TaxID=3155505 RepID=UPI00343D6547
SPSTPPSPSTSPSPSTPPSPSTSPSPSTPPSPSTSPSPSAPPGSCRVSAVITAWNTGLVENLTVTNTTNAAINGWSLVFTLPGGQVITSGWNAAYSPTSGQVTARNLAYNAAIPANGSVSIGFQANHTGNAGRPTAFILNGATCVIA